VKTVLTGCSMTSDTSMLTACSLIHESSAGAMVDIGHCQGMPGRMSGKRIIDGAA
jgi:hypothetical protein